MNKDQNFNHYMVIEGKDTGHLLLVPCEINSNNSLNSLNSFLEYINENGHIYERVETSSSLRFSILTGNTAVCLHKNDSRICYLFSYDTGDCILFHPGELTKDDISCLAAMHGLIIAETPELLDETVSIVIDNYTERKKIMALESANDLYTIFKNVS